MQCPFCKQEMVEGKIFGEGYGLKWLPLNKKLFLGIWAVGGIKLKNSSFWGRTSTSALYCGECEKIIIDLK